MDKEYELRKAKRLALSLLVFAVCVFISTLFLPKGVWWVDLMRAISEAAMVGALADWFAVVALFKRVPIPFIAAHTEIIPKNKVNIANNLAIFVRDKFLDVDSIVALIQKHDPAQKIADWLVERKNTEKLGGYLVKMTANILDFIEDNAIQNFMKKAVHALLEKTDLSKSAGIILETLTRNGRHQALLDEAINQFAKILNDEETRRIIANEIVTWLKEEHPVTEKVLPSAWIGKTGAEIAINAASNLLNNVNTNPQHPLRESFDAFTKEFIVKLQQDPEFAAKGEEIKHYLQNDETFNAYLKELWGDMKDWLKSDLKNTHSIFHQKIIGAGLWIGTTLANDPALRTSLNDHMEDAARKMAPDFAHFLTTHISDTVKNWDSTDMSKQIELNIGKDLQFIRINGTIVGGCIGLLLYTIAHIQDLLKIFI